MQLLESKTSKPELSLKDVKQIVESNYFLFGLNMEGYIPIPPLPDDERITMVYYQNAWKFFEDLSKPKDGPLPLPPLKSPPENKDEKMR